LATARTFLQSIAYAINESDAVVGETITSTKQVRRSLFKPGGSPNRWFRQEALGINAVMSALPLLGGQQGSAFALNDPREIVGYSALADGAKHPSEWVDLAEWQPRVDKSYAARRSRCGFRLYATYLYAGPETFVFIDV